MPTKKTEEQNGKKITATVLKRNVKKMWFVSVLFRLESWESHELQSITYILAMKFHTEKTASAERLNYNHYNEEKRGKLRRCSNRNSNYYVFGVAFICLGSTKAKQKKNNQNRRREAKKNTDTSSALHVRLYLLYFILFYWCLAYSIFRWDSTPLPSSTISGP